MSRVARCGSCKTERPSDPSLAFFEDRSPEAFKDTQTCRHCRYHHNAHVRKAKGGERHLTFVCDNFEAMTEGYDVDTFYCGCKGWD